MLSGPEIAVVEIREVLPNADQANPKAVRIWNGAVATLAEIFSEIHKYKVVLRAECHALQEEIESEEEEESDE